MGIWIGARIAPKLHERLKREVEDGGFSQLSDLVRAKLRLPLVQGLWPVCRRCSGVLVDSVIGRCDIVCASCGAKFYLQEESQREAEEIRGSVKSASDLTL